MVEHYAKILSSGEKAIISKIIKLMIVATTLGEEEEEEVFCRVMKSSRALRVFVSAIFFHSRSCLEEVTNVYQSSGFSK